MSSKKEINLELIELFNLFKELIKDDSNDDNTTIKKIQLTKKLFELKDFITKLEKSNEKRFEYKETDVKQNYYDFLGSTPTEPSSITEELKKNNYKRFYDFIHKVSQLFKEDKFKNFFDFEKKALDNSKSKLDKLYDNLFKKFQKKFDELVKNENTKNFINLIKKRYQQQLLEMYRLKDKEKEVILQVIKNDKDKEIFKKDFQDEFDSSQKRIDVDVKEFENLLTKALENNKQELITDFQGYTEEDLFQYLNYYFNQYLHKLNELINSKSNENEIIKLLTDAFNLKIQVSSSKKSFDEDLKQKYENDDFKNGVLNEYDEIIKIYGENYKSKVD